MSLIDLYSETGINFMVSAEKEMCEEDAENEKIEELAHMYYKDPEICRKRMEMKGWSKEKIQEIVNAF